MVLFSKDEYNILLYKVPRTGTDYGYSLKCTMGVALAT